MYPVVAKSCADEVRHSLQGHGVALLQCSASLSYDVEVGCPTPGLQLSEPDQLCERNPIDEDRRPHPLDHAT